MDTSTGQTAMTTEQAMTIQMDAAERLARAQVELDIARLRLSTLVRGAPLRFEIEGTERYRRAQTELGAAQAAYDAAQDIDCPETEA